MSLAEVLILEEFGKTFDITIKYIIRSIMQELYSTIEPSKTMAMGVVSYCDSGYFGYWHS